ncbi:MAG: FkbM family methyltransferase, partial [Candidatus Pacebacteria bacterium]|nr:FkbM family methyltransferase [Candidatus Paceibacterota bacterium]
ELNDRVIKVKTAISDYEGKAVLNFRFACDEMATLDKNTHSDYSEEVPVTTINSFSKKRGIESVDFIKIDTEGFEKEVLAGLGQLKPKYVQLEFNINHLQRDHTFLEISRLLPGYVFYRLLPNGWLKIDPAKYLSNIYIFSNIIAVRNDVN